MRGGGNTPLRVARARARLDLARHKSPRMHTRLPPEILEPRRSQLGVPHRMLDVLVPEVGL